LPDQDPHDRPVAPRLSGRGGAGDVRRRHAAILVKPFDNDALLKALKQVIQ